MGPKTIEEVKADMSVLDPDINYYVITLTADDQRRVTVGTHTHFEGWGDSECRTEIRTPSLVKPEFFINFWTDTNEGHWIVKNEEEWLVF